MNLPVPIGHGELNVHAELEMLLAENLRSYLKINICHVRFHFGHCEKHLRTVVTRYCGLALGMGIFNVRPQNTPIIAHIVALFTRQCFLFMFPSPMI